MAELIRVRDNYPGDKKLEKHLQKLREILNEGVKNKKLEATFMTAGIVEVRRILEHILWQYWIMIDKGNEKADTFDQINELKIRGILTEQQASFLHEVRMAANAEVHNSSNKKAKVKTMSDLVGLCNGLSDFIFNKFRNDVPKRLFQKTKPKSGSKRKGIPIYQPESLSMEQIIRIKTQMAQAEKTAVHQSPVASSRPVVSSRPVASSQQPIQKQEKTFKSYRDETFVMPFGIFEEIYPRACLEEHIISAREYERLRPCWSLDARMNPGIWKNNAGLVKLHDKVLWEGRKIVSLMFVEKKKRAGNLPKEDQELIDVSKKCRKKEARYKAGDVSFLQIMQDSLYPQKYNAPWIMLTCDGCSEYKKISLVNYTCGWWVDQSDMPENRKKKIKRANKAAFLSVIAIDSLLLLAMVALFLWTLLFIWNIHRGEPAGDVITLVMFVALFDVAILAYPFMEVLDRLSDWWRRFKANCT